MVNSEGLIDPIWLRFFIDLYERTGGGGVDKVDAGANAAETAQAAADQAQVLVDEVDRRIGFDFEFDLR